MKTIVSITIPSIEPDKVFNTLKYFSITLLISFLCYQAILFWFRVIKSGYTKARIIEFYQNPPKTNYYANEDRKYSYKDIVNKQYHEAGDISGQTQQPLTGIPKSLEIKFNGEKDINRRQPFTQEKIDYAQIPDERICANNMFTDCSALPANSNSNNLFDPYSNTSSAYSL